MTKKVIAIISVLKPVDDTRNFEKIAITISNTNKYDINIIGFSTKIIPSYPNVTFIPIFNFKRTSVNRLLSGWQIFKYLLKVKPELIIVTCAELLIVTIAYRIIFGAKLIYDIQENYYRNIVYTNTLPTLAKYPTAMLTRFVEFISSVFIQRFFLAEEVYKNQLGFAASNSVVIENKAIIPKEINKKNRSDNKEIKFIYCGTISEHYGIFNAIEFIDRIRAIKNNATLVIVGYAAQESIYRKVINAIYNKDYIRLIGGNELVPHNQILIEMQRANFCLLPYHTNKSTQGRIPTKLFECLAMELPVIVSSNPAWNSMIEKNNAGIIHNFKLSNDFQIDKLSGKFYGNNLSHEYDWELESSKLIKEINAILQ